METKRRGVLVALEGIDGAGKTTQATRLAEALASGGHKVVRSKEPTDGQWGRRLRESAKMGRLSPQDELALFLKDRQEHVETLLRPEIEAGSVVIVDRYYFSTIAYQGARGMDVRALQALNEAFAPQPDLLVVIDIDPKVGLERIRQRGDEANEFEREAGLAESRRIFRELDLPYLMRIDGTLPVEAITAGILEQLYDGPLSAVKTHDAAPRANAGGRPVTTGDLWSEVAKAG